jgi:mediator of RNA polymerase II transcription subunit 31
MSDLSEEERFHLELEFVQLLSNSKYLHYLALNNYLEDDKFLNFLRYLQYWKQDAYCQYITFPHSIPMLDALITSKRFRDSLKSPQFIEELHTQQGFHWIKGPD